MTKHKTPSTYILAAIIMPAMVMASARFIGKAPAESKGSPIVSPPAEFISFPSISLAKTDRTLTRNVDSPIKSPFWFEEIIFDNNQANSDPENTDIKPIIQEHIPAIVVTSILPNSKNPVAIINAKIRKIGDDIGDGWKLIEINGNSRTVTFSQKSGRRFTVALSKSHVPS